MPAFPGLSPRRNGRSEGSYSPCTSAVRRAGHTEWGPHRSLTIRRKPVGRRQEAVGSRGRGVPVLAADCRLLSAAFCPGVGGRGELLNSFQRFGAVALCS